MKKRNYMIFPIITILLATTLFGVTANTFALENNTSNSSESKGHTPNTVDDLSVKSSSFCSYAKWKEDNGKIHKIMPGGEGVIWCNALTEFPNGLCLNKDETYLYVAMSLNPPRVSQVEITSDGSAGTVETVVNMPKTVPDGLAFDTEGNLYISCYRPDAIYRFTPNGELQVLAEDYEGTAISAPTNVAFCGKKLDMLLSTNLGRWHLTRYHLDAVGMPLNYPILS